MRDSIMNLSIKNKNLILAGLVLIVLGASLAANWNHVKTINIYVVFKRLFFSLPEIEPGKFGLIVLRPQDELKQSYSKEIEDTLSDFSKVQVIELIANEVSTNQNISSNTPIVQGRNYQELFKETHASMIVRVHPYKENNKDVYELSWGLPVATSDSVLTEKIPYIEAQTMTLLGIIVAAQLSKDPFYFNHTTAEIFKTYLGRMRSFFKTQTHDFNIDKLNTATMIFADGMGTYGIQANEKIPLDESISIYQSIQARLKKDESLGVRAKIYEKQGKALKYLIENQQNYDIEQVGDAIEVYQALIRIYTHQKLPLERARALVALADLYYQLGEKGTHIPSLIHAVGNYKEALLEISQQKKPEEWSAIQNRLGDALLRLGEKENGTEHLEASVLAYQAALKERTRERFPKQWAETQNSLATALIRLGERDKDVIRIKQAITLYRLVLTACPTKAPYDCAATHNNLGGALAALGEQERDPEKIAQAITAYRSALQYWRKDNFPEDWASAKNNLGSTLVAMAHYSDKRGLLEEAIAAYYDALTIYSGEKLVSYWTMTKINLALALAEKGRRDRDVKSLNQSLEILDAVYEANHSINIFQHDKYLSDLKDQIQEDVSTILKTGFYKK
ncbi:MAG: tetratricopeptide repeat protein [Pseudomonadota bacterium]